ncbi:MAG: hypothetical protein U0Q22_13515 [Acidimicrobiales bacterium]
MSDDPTLTPDDIDRALHTTLARGARLVHRRNRRMAAVSGAAVAVLLAGGFGMLRSLGDDGRVVVTPADKGAGVTSTVTSTVPTASDTTIAPAALDTTTTAPATIGTGDTVLAPTVPSTTGPSVPTTTVLPPAAPPGWVRTELPGGVTSLVNGNPLPTEPSTSIDSSGATIGGATSQARSEAIVSYKVLSPYLLHVQFACTNVFNRIDVVLFKRSGSTVTVQGQTTGGSTGEPCAAGVGPGIDLMFPDGGLAARTTVVAGIFDGVDG